MAPRIDWSNLHEDFLLLIFQWLPITDLLRSATVCSSWSSIIRDIPRHRHFSHARRAPWLLLSGELNDDVATAPNSVATFYDPLENNLHAVPLRNPSIVDSVRLCIGSSEGWLVAADDLAQLHLLNPITGEKIDLPPPTSFDHVDPLDDLRYFSYSKAFLSISPSKKNYALVVIHGPLHLLSLARAGDVKWTTLSETSYHDGAILGNKLYAVCWNGAIEVWDLNKTSLEISAMMLPKPQRNVTASTFYKYLVPHPSGDVLQVWREWDGFLSIKFSVFRIEITATDIELVEVQSLGDYALLVAMNHSMCIPCNDSHGVRANCVYFDENELKMNDRAIRVYSLEDGSVEPAANYDFDHNGRSWKWATWFAPSLV